MSITANTIELGDIVAGDQVVLQDAAKNVAAGIVGASTTAKWITAFGTAIRFAEINRNDTWKGTKGVRVVGYTPTLV